MRRTAIALLMTMCAGLAAQGEDNTLTAEEKAGGWILLWDGKTYDGWTNSKLTPSERALPGDGTLAPLGCGGYLLIHDTMWSDFILSLDFKLTPEANSGIFIRTSPLRPRKDSKLWRHAIEIQVLDSETATMQDSGSFYDLVAPTRNALKPLGEWNRMVITCQGSVIGVNLNGEDVSEIDLDDYKRKRRRPDGSEHKFPVAFKKHPREGYIGLQDHGDEVWYKNIKLKPLND